MAKKKEKPERIEFGWNYCSMPEITVDRRGGRITDKFIREHVATKLDAELRRLAEQHEKQARAYRRQLEHGPFGQVVRAVKTAATWTAGLSKPKGIKREVAEVVAGLLAGDELISRHCGILRIWGYVRGREGYPVVIFDLKDVAVIGEQHEAINIRAVFAVSDCRHLRHLVDECSPVGRVWNGPGSMTFSVQLSRMAKKPKAVRSK